MRAYSPIVLLEPFGSVANTRHTNSKMVEMIKSVLREFAKLIGVLHVDLGENQDFLREGTKRYVTTHVNQLADHENLREWW